jgi:hypothetical protein
MQELTKNNLTIIGTTSLVTVALAAGILAVFHSEIENKIRHAVERNRSVSGKDTPVGVRGGSIIAIAHASGGWEPTDQPNTLKAEVVGTDGEPVDKTIINVSGEALDDKTYTAPKSWVMAFLGRGDQGTYVTFQIDPVTKTVVTKNQHGYMLCSNPDCQAGASVDQTNYVYLKLIDPGDTLGRPDLDDEDAVIAPVGQRLIRHRVAFQNNVSGCRSCNYVSDIVPDAVTEPDILKAGKVKTRCRNSVCQVKIGYEQ